MTESNQDTNGHILEEKEVQKEVTFLDTNHPLLNEFRELAPGSYKHTQSLLAIVENVCASLDIDPKPLKFASLYHDIGKMWAPHFYSENQPTEENIHDSLTPEISFHLITRHVSDSICILVNNNVPMEIIKLVSQHHGTTILKAIYEKAKKIDKDIREELFRYHTEKPVSLEAMILMLCDKIEAASRSYYTSDKSKVLSPDIFVQTMYNELLLDGQFDDVTLKLGAVSKIQKALTIDVSSLFHKRVSYEDITISDEPIPEKM